MCLRLVGKMNTFLLSLGERQKWQGDEGARKEGRVRRPPVWRCLCSGGDAWALGGRWKYERKKIHREILMSPGNTREHVGQLFGLGEDTGIFRGLSSFPERTTFYMSSSWRSHVNLLCIVPISVYVLLKWAQYILNVCNNFFFCARCCSIKWRHKVQLPIFYIIFIQFLKWLWLVIL